MSVDPSPRPSAEQALGDAVSRWLHALGEGDAALVAQRGRFESYSENEVWQIGDRRVQAQHLAIVLPPEELAKLERRPALRELLRRAVSNAVQSFETSLAELSFFVELPLARGTWGAAYRELPRQVPAEPTADQVLRASIELANALSEPSVARMLSGAELEVGVIGDGELRRWVVRLPAEAVARTQQDGRLLATIVRVVRLAATSAVTRISEVEVGVRASKI